MTPVTKEQLQVFADMIGGHLVWEPFRRRWLLYADDVRYDSQRIYDAVATCVRALHRATRWYLFLRG